MPLAAETRKSYASALRMIKPALGGRTLLQVSQDRELVTSILADSNGRAKIARNVLVGACNEAVNAGTITSHRLNGIKVARRAADKPATIVPLTTAQLDELALKLRPQLALSVWIMRGAGLRISEALAVRADSLVDNGHGRALRVSAQISRAGEVIPLKHKAAGEYRDVPCPVWLWDKVTAHVERYGTWNGFLFSNAARNGHATYNGYHPRFADAVEALWPCHSRLTICATCSRRLCYRPGCRSRTLPSGSGTPTLASLALSTRTCCRTHNSAAGKCWRASCRGSKTESQPTGSAATSTTTRAARAERQDAH